jgi:aminopeptidase N
VAEHEIAHSYFPFHMGINETRYGFMDEGWATALEYLVSQDDVGHEKAAEDFRQNRVGGWIDDRSPFQDLPIVTPHAAGNNAYVKPALGYLAVKEMLGDSLFRLGLHAYIDRWHGKHPTPWDFFNTMNSATGQNLNWFWQNWYFSNNYIDVGVGRVTRTRRGYQVVIDNIGGMAAPVELRLRYADGSADTVRQTSSMWQADQRRATVLIPTSSRLESLTLDLGIWMDADATNNGWTAK